MMFLRKGMEAGTAVGIIDAPQSAAPNALSKAAQAMQNTHALERLIRLILSLLDKIPLSYLVVRRKN